MHYIIKNNHHKIFSQEAQITMVTCRILPLIILLHPCISIIAMDKIPLRPFQDKTLGPIACGLNCNVNAASEKPPSMDSNSPTNNPRLIFSQKGNSAGSELLKEHIDSLSDGDSLSLTTATITNSTNKKQKGDSFIERLKAAKLRGADINITISPHGGSDRTVIRMLQDSGIIVNQLPNNHDNSYTIERKDGTTECGLSSSRCTNNGFFGNYEVSLIDPALAESFKAIDDRRRSYATVLKSPDSPGLQSIKQKLAADRNKNRLSLTPPQVTVRASDVDDLFADAKGFVDRASANSKIKVATMTLNPQILNSIKNKPESLFVLPRQALNNKTSPQIQEAVNQGLDVRILDQHNLLHEKLLIKSEPRGAHLSPKKLVVVSTANFNNAQRQHNKMVIYPHHKALYEQADTHIDNLARMAIPFNQFKKDNEKKSAIKKLLEPTKSIGQRKRSSKLKNISSAVIKSVNDRLPTGI